MSEQFFVRIRGRVHGPFDGKKVKMMVQNGQLSRIHQISTDGQDWQKASSFPEFFESVVDVEPIVLQEAAQIANYASATSQTTVIENSGSNETQEWYYSSNEKQFGPISFSQLTQIASVGTIQANDLVWCDKFTDWQRASSVEGLFGDPSTAQQPEENQPATYSEPQADSTDNTLPQSETLGGGIDRESLSTMSKSRGWIYLSSVIFVLIGLASIIGGFLCSILGAQARNYSMIAQGVLLVLFAGMMFFGAFFMIRIALMIGRCVRVPSYGNLNSMLRSSRSFWVFASIGTILYFVFVAMAVLAILAVTNFGGDATNTSASHDLTRLFLHLV